MDRLQRIYKLHRVISSRRHPVPRTTLEQELECSRATVKRIIQEMKLYFNAPLEYDRERNGYYYDTQAEQTFELPGVWFNESELHALLTTQQLLEQLQPGLLDSHLKPLKDRVEKLLAAGQHDSSEIAKRVRILRMAGRNTSGEHFQTVAGALLQRRRLAIRYHGRSNDEESQREISPQRLTHYRDNWYLDAWCHQRNALRSFAVDRLREAKALGKRAKDIAEKELDAHFASSYGIFAGKPNYTAVLHFTPQRARWVAEEQWHPQQQGRMIEDGGYELRIPYSDPRELVMDILKHGAEVEVVAPDALRQLVIEQLRNALGKYEKTPPLSRSRERVGKRV
ncbi:MAG: transcriptional regulator [Gallionellales bacterium GWA2_60_18]|nr:MAG: transcriptional regulator [Gallionellales bacterium GWA2_60_18]